jgi:hypothetical protein
MGAVVPTSTALPRLEGPQAFRHRRPHRCRWRAAGAPAPGAQAGWEFPQGLATGTGRRRQESDPELLNGIFRAAHSQGCTSLPKSAPVPGARLGAALWFVTVSALDERNDFAEYLMPKIEAALPLARVTGDA